MSASVWGFSFLSVTLISAFSLTGVFVAPLMKTRHAKHALAFFMALAIGTLLSTAVLQLLPEVCYEAPPRTASEASVLPLLGFLLVSSELGSLPVF